MNLLVSLCLELYSFIEYTCVFDAEDVRNIFDWVSVDDEHYATKKSLSRDEMCSFPFVKSHMVSLRLVWTFFFGWTLKSKLWSIFFFRLLTCSFICLHCSDKSFHSLIKYAYDSLITLQCRRDRYWFDEFINDNVSHQLFWLIRHMSSFSVFIFVLLICIPPMFVCYRLIE